MNASAAASSRNRRRQAAKKLAAYAAAPLSLGLLSCGETDAAVVSIDIGPTGFNIAGINAGLSAGTSEARANFPTIGGGTLNLFNTFNEGTASSIGINPVYGGVPPGFQFATGNTFYTSPTNFAAGQTVGSSSISGDYINSFFKWFSEGEGPFVYTPTTFTSPDFGPGSYMGFRDLLGRYGYLEVTWSSSSSQFQILSGAYESVPGTPIVVPEPATMGAIGVAALALGAGAIRRSRKARKEIAAAG
jgi:hypothetical protein